jgi:hypothetical protein
VLSCFVWSVATHVLLSASQKTSRSSQNISLLYDVKDKKHKILSSTYISAFNKIHIFFHGTRATSVSGPPQYRGFTITLRHTTLGRTPLDEWLARRRDLYLNTHETDIHAPGRIRTHNPSKPAPADPCLRPRGNCDRLVLTIIFFFAWWRAPQQTLRTHRSLKASCATHVMKMSSFFTKFYD